MNTLAWVMMARVLTVAPDGFVSEHVIDFKATPDVVYSALTQDVGSWWDATHSYTGEAANFSLDARPQGCFCEHFPDGSGVEHMRVVHARPGELLRMTGGLGPLQAMPVTGVMEFQLEATRKGTRLTYRYTVAGNASAGLDALAAPVDAVQLGQLKRLLNYVEGKPATDAN
ncbi:MAG: SRPBCC domain-containing protein [Pseudomonadales bacterium]